MTNQYILVYDTSANACNVGLFFNKQLISHELYECKYGHAEHINDLIKKTICSAGINFNDIHDIYTTIGPGSFTGIRVGLSVAKILELSLKINIKGINSFSISKYFYEKQQHQNEDFLITLDTRKNDFYTQLNGIGPTKSLNLEEIKEQFDFNTIITGDGAIKLKNHGFRIVEQPAFFNIEDIFHTGLKITERSLSPYYLAPPKISLRKTSKSLPFKL